MVLDIAVSVIAFMFVILVAILSFLFIKMKNLATKIDHWLKGVKEKTERLDLIFHPPKALRKGSGKGEMPEALSDLFEWVSVSLALFNKVRRVFKRHEK